MLLVGAVNVGDTCVLDLPRPIVERLQCTHLSKVLAALSGLVTRCWTAVQCCVAWLDCGRGVLAKARCTAGQRLAGRLSVPS